MAFRLRARGRFLGVSNGLLAGACAWAAAGAASAEEILMQTFSAESVSERVDVERRAQFLGADQVGAMRRSITESLPEGTQFVIDHRGAAGKPVDDRARFASVKMPVLGDANTGVYAQLGFGRDREMKDASNRNLATKMVVGGRLGLGLGMESFLEYRQLRGFDFRGVSAPEHQASLGVTIRF